MNSIFSFKYISILLVGGLLSALSCIFYSPSGSTLQSMLISAVFVLLSANMTVENQLYLIAMGIPNTIALGFDGISASICVCTIAVFKYFILNKKLPKLPIGVLLYLFFWLLTAFRYDDIVGGVVMPIKQMINMIFFVILASSPSISKNSFNVGLKSSLALFCGIVFAFGASLAGASEVGRIAVVGNDANMLAVEVAFVLSYLCVAKLKGETLSFFPFMTFVLILAIICILCGSRMGFLLFAIILSCTLLMNAGKSTSLILVAILLVIAGSFFIQSQIGQNVIGAIQFRMEVLENNDDVSNGRLEIWDQYITALTATPDRLLFGLGDYTKFGIENQAHNFFIEDLACYGIIGLLIIYPTYIGIYRRQFRAIKYHSGKTRIKFFNYLPLLTPIVGSLTLHGLGSIMCTTMIYLGVLSLVTPKDQQY